MDKFKIIFKKYKHFDITSDHDNEVIDFHHPEKFHDKIIEVPLKLSNFNSDIKNDLIDINQWRVFTLKNFIPGLYVIPSILTKEASQRWFDYLLNQVPISFENQFKANISLPPQQPIKQSNLRWITFGYHHNWDTKVYENDMVSPIPELINQFAQFVSMTLGFTDFKTEAGIINYYNCKSNLCPHSDHSEPNKTAPLFSLSLGCSAIFIIGGETRESHLPIYPLLLNDCDLLIMSDQSRQAIHGVPKIICDNKTNCKEIKRINVNIRQVN